MDSAPQIPLNRPGGCECKLPSEMLQKFSGNLNLQETLANWEDCGWFQLPNDELLLTSIDFGTLICSDAQLAGQICATNALSDIFACGGKPLFCTGMLIWPNSPETIESGKSLLKGAKKVFQEMNTPVLNMHTMEGNEVVLGYSVVGKCKKNELVKKSTLQDGDSIFLTKPLGIPLYFEALKFGILEKNQINCLVSHSTSLNTYGLTLARNKWATAMTDVSGFGLIGHLAEMVVPTNLTAIIEIKQLPIPFEAESIYESISVYREYCITKKREQAWQQYSQYISGNVSEFQRNILIEPQTSGGLLFTSKKSLSELQSHLPDNQTLTKIGTIAKIKNSKPISFK